jgi:hypothetical protein
MAGRKLKVFQAQFGFFDTVVAAPSRAAALRAWGTHQDLFAGGDARPITDEAAIAAAVKHPETPLRRAVGSADPFELEPRRLPVVPDPSKASKAKRPKRGKLKRKPYAPPTPPDRSRLDAAEKALRKLDKARGQEEAALARRQRALEAETLAKRCAYVAARKQATAAIVVAREAYRRAGGSD